MKIKELLDDYKLECNSFIEEFLEKKVAQAGKVFPEAEFFVKRVSEYVLRGGKRIRPFLINIGYKAVNRNDLRDSSITVAYEFLHSYLLIHDDIMDESDKRRSGITFHKTFENMGAERGFSEPAKFGENVGIIAGDLISEYGVELINQSNFSDNLKNKIIEIYTRMNEYTSFGQLLDEINGKKGIDEVTIKDIELVHKYKTSKYTIEGPLHFGAVLGGASKSQLESLTEYAIQIGIAFQHCDDLLGLFGDEDIIGKPVFSDLKEGKKTLFILEAYRDGTKSQRETILSSLGNKNLTEKEGFEVREIIKETGALNSTKKRCDELKEKAISALRKAEVYEDVKNNLENLAEYIINRNN